MKKHGSCSTQLVYFIYKVISKVIKRFFWNKLITYVVSHAV